MRKINCLIISSLLGLVGIVSAQGEWSSLEKNCLIQPAPTSSAVYGLPNFSPLNVNQTVPLPQAGAADGSPMRVKGLLEETTSKGILKPGQSLVFELDNSSVKVDSSVWEQLPAEVEAAIARTPSWLHYDLRFKFRQITNATHRNNMVALLNGTPKQYLDEVAFQLTYLPYEVLKDSRFVNTPKS